MVFFSFQSSAKNLDPCYTFIILQNYLGYRLREGDGEEWGGERDTGMEVPEEAR